MDKDITKGKRIIESIYVWETTGYIQCILIYIRIQIIFLLAVGPIYSDWVFVDLYN